MSLPLLWNHQRSKSKKYSSLVSAETKNFYIKLRCVKKKWKRAEETLKILDETEDIWLRRSPELHAALKEEVSFKVILLVAI